MRDKYSLQSLATIMPAKIVKKFNIDPSTILAASGWQNNDNSLVQILEAQLFYKKDMITTTPTGESFQASSQQVLSEAQ